MEPRVRQHIDDILRALGEVRQAKGEGPLARFLRRLARGDARRLRAFHDLAGGALEEALREALARLPEAELARIAARLTERPDEALGALSGSAAVRHTLLTRACGRLLDTRPLEPGEKVDGRYEVAELVGVGGMGIVYRAIDTETSEVVAVKVLRAELTRDPACVRRFLESAQLGKTLEHEGIVRVKEVSAAGQVPYLTMDWVEGPTLRALLDEREKLSWEVAAPIVKGVLSALSAAHEKGVLHLDLKPENVLLPTMDAPKLCDFDLARVVERTGGLSLLPGSGTPDYMSPEQRREGLVDRRSDVFSAGVMIYEMLSGRLPGRYTPMLHTGFGAPTALSRAVEAALHDDPARRPEDAAGFLREINGTHEEPTQQEAASNQQLSFEGVLEQLGTDVEDAKSFADFIKATEKATAKLSHPEGAPFVLLGHNAQGFKEVRNKKDGSSLIYLPSGDIMMGARDKRSQGWVPVHQISVYPHFIGKMPVTNNQYREFCKQTGHAPPSQPKPGWGYTKYFEDLRYGDHPVVGVTWADAMTYCEWAGLRLPTEAEWERAARWVPEGLHREQFPWGDDLPNDQLAIFGKEPGEGRYTRSVGSCPEGASPCGAMDMAGNAWEWCLDWYDEDYYAQCGTHVVNPMGPNTGTERVLRGGAWCNDARFLRVYFRDSDDPAKTFNAVGFRVARDVK